MKVIVAFMNFCKFAINIVFAIPFGAASGTETTFFVFHFIEQGLQQHFMCKLGTWHYGIFCAFCLHHEETAPLRASLE